jgi:hypothetical protein
MTATFAADFGTFWRSGGRNDWPQLTVVAPAATNTASVLGEPGKGTWKLDAIRELVRQQWKYGAYLHPHALARFLDWIKELPDALPRAAVAAGEDGSLYVEWDVAGNSLHVSFHSDGDEVYFAGDNGDEWEANEVIGLRKLEHAIEHIRAAT